MAGFYFTLLAVLLAGFGARDQMVLARLTLAQGARPAVLLAGIAVSLATAVFAGWGAGAVAPLMAARARLVLAAIALAMAGGEALLAGTPRRPQEPTHSLGALTVVLLAHQITDAPRFLVFAIAVGTNTPLPSAIAGAIGGAALLAAAWFAPETVLRPRLRLVRRLTGAVLLLAALYVAAQAFG